jgi:hypothetical protein
VPLDLKCLFFLLSAAVPIVVVSIILKASSSRVCGRKDYQLEFSGDAAAAAQGPPLRQQKLYQQGKTHERPYTASRQATNEMGLLRKLGLRNKKNKNDDNSSNSKWKPTAAEVDSSNNNKKKKTNMGCSQSKSATAAVVGTTKNPKGAAGVCCLFFHVSSVRVLLSFCFCLKERERDLRVTISLDG